MVSRALMTTVLPAAPAAPTYGELVDLARHRADVACERGSGPFASAAEAVRAVAGYERYLAIVGRHLRLVAPAGLGVAQGPTTSLPVLHQLVQRMALLTLGPSQDSLWGAAADALATAHDLLATHLGPAGERRTSEVEPLEDPRQRDATTHVVLGLLDRPLTRRDDLLAAVTAAAKDEVQLPSPRAVAAHLRQSTDAIGRLSDLYVESTSTQGDVTIEVRTLEPAVPSSPGASRPRPFEDSLQALRVLRVLSFRQTTGAEQASPGSLHDLARLARAATSDADRWLPPAQTPISRVQRANALDQLDRASAAWQDATTALGQHVRGLTKAPRLYADAVGFLHQAHNHEAVRRAVLASLPRLGNEAGLTTTRLADRRCLTIAVKEVGRFQESWRLVAPDESRDLAARFTNAGHTSRAAHLAVAQLDRSAGRRTQSDECTGSTRLQRGRAVEGLAR